MKNYRKPGASSAFTSIAFLENVMPQIKINQKRFPLKGIDPDGVNKETTSSTSRIYTDHSES